MAVFLSISRHTVCAAEGMPLVSHLLHSTTTVDEGER